MVFPRLWLINMMNVFKASRKFSALSSSAGTRTGNFFPAKQIFPFGKIRAISFPWLLLPFLLFPDRRIWVKIPESLKKYRVKLYLGIYNRVTNFSYMFHSSWDISASLCGQIGKKWSNEGKRALDRLSRNDSDPRVIWLRGAIIKKARRPTTTLLTSIFKCRVRTLEDAARSFYTLLVTTTKLSFVLSQIKHMATKVVDY